MKPRYFISAVALASLLAGCGWILPTSEVKKEQPVAQTAAKPAGAGADSRKVRPECVDMVRIFESALGPLDGETPLANIAAIQKASDAAGEDPTSCLAARIDSLNRREREKLVTLTVGGASVRPSLILTCGKLDEGLVCRGAVADDTAHATEFEEKPALLKADDAVQLTLSESYRPGDLKMYQIVTHGAEPQPVERAADGALALGEFKEGARVIFAIAREPGGYVKYVWVIKTQG